MNHLWKVALKLLSFMESGTLITSACSLLTKSDSPSLVPTNDTLPVACDLEPRVQRLVAWKVHDLPCWGRPVKICDLLSTRVPSELLRKMPSPTMVSMYCLEMLQSSTLAVRRRLLSSLCQPNSFKHRLSLVRAKSDP